MRSHFEANAIANDSMTQARQRCRRSPMLRDSAVLAASLVLSACATSVAPVATPSAELVWAGAFRSVGGERVADSRSPTGSSQLNAERIPLGSEGTIPGQLGTSFGAGWRFTEMAKVRRVDYKAVWHIPAPGLINPATGKQTSVVEIKSYCSVEKACTTGWQLIQPWEIVPGTWVLEIQVEGLVVLRQDFNVVTN